MARRQLQQGQWTEGNDYKQKQRMYNFQIILWASASQSNNNQINFSYFLYEIIL
jgi:hypothetical protein